MSNKMKAQVLTGINQMEMVDWPKPEIENDNQVLIRVKTVGVCGSDVHYYETGRIGEQVVEYPYLVGHECAGIVEKIGGKVTRVRPGDEIVVEPAQWCNECDQCRMGRENTCRKLSFLGTPGQGDGCLCEYIVMNEQSCFPTNRQIDLIQGAVCEPFAIGVYCVKQAGLRGGEKTAVFGAGPIGLCCIAAAKAQGVDKFYVTEKIPERIQTAKKTGPELVVNPESEDVVSAIESREPAGIDIAFECAGQQSTIDEAVEVLRPGGKLILVGIPRESRVSFSIDRLRRKEITVVNIRRQNDCTQKAIDLIAQKKVDIEFMVTHRFDFQDAKKAFELVAGYKDGVVKAMIEL